MIRLSILSIGVIILAEVGGTAGGSQYAEWTALAAIRFIVVWLITKTLPAVSVSQQNTIVSLTAQTEALRATLDRLTEVVSKLSHRQEEIASLVESNHKIVELQIRQSDTLQVVVTEIMKTMVDARNMMAPVPEPREEQNKLMREMISLMVKKE